MRAEVVASLRRSKFVSASKQQIAEGVEESLPWCRLFTKRSTDEVSVLKGDHELCVYIR